MKSNLKDQLKQEMLDKFSKKLRQLVYAWREDRAVRSLPATNIDLAGLLGTNRNSITRWLSGKEYPSPDSMKRIMDFFHVDSEYFTGKQDENNVSYLDIVPDTAESLVMKETPGLPTEQFIRFTSAHPALAKELMVLSDMAADEDAKGQKLSPEATKILAQVEQEIVHYAGYLLQDLSAKKNKS